MWTKIIAHRLVFLIGVLVTAVLLAVLTQAKIPVVSVVCTALLGVLWVGFPIAALVALRARQPETFLVRGGTFTTTPSANAVLSAATGTAIPVALATLAVDEEQLTGDWFPIAVVVVLLLVLLPLQWYGVLGPFGMVLAPDGVHDRQPLGSVFVPWAAGPAAQPGNSGVTVRVAHPELVVRRGFRPGMTVRTGADRGFAAWAINLYAARADYRPAIGTSDGLARLTSR
jgi:hypothetical protein